MCDLVIGFDADDTLWHNETLFSLTQQRFQQLLEPYRQQTWTGQELFETEIRNLDYFGYGIKGFTLSMIETAIEVTNGQVAARDIQQIVDFAKEMLRAPVQLIEQAADVVATLAQTHTLMLITKGDLFDQESKIAQSGLAEYFTHVEIVRDKTPEVYQALLARHGLAPAHFVMVGNSVKSDILPVVEIGGKAVHIPYHITWEHETITQPGARMGYVEIEHIGQLPAYIEQLRGMR
ncbi:MAG TPA: HAD family hydrolase [Roseiflexaceae bacterium]|jgi:putative hydrolase of the HAD superfamily|nr:HAD family hydrolase [Roseiflexaceae bacterium]